MIRTFYRKMILSHHVSNAHRHPNPSPEYGHQALRTPCKPQHLLVNQNEVAHWHIQRQRAPSNDQSQVVQSHRHTLYHRSNACRDNPQHTCSLIQNLVLLGHLLRQSFPMQSIQSCGFGGHLLVEWRSTLQGHVL